MEERLTERAIKERHIGAISRASVLRVYNNDSLYALYFLRLSGVVLQEEKKMEASGFK